MQCQQTVFKLKSGRQLLLVRNGGQHMIRTITLDVMWQIDTLTGEAGDPDERYDYGGENCFRGEGTMTLVEREPGVFAGHVDFDRSTGHAQHLAVFLGEPAVIAQQMVQTHSYLNAKRRDGLGVSAQPAHILVWVREFKDIGGPETDAYCIYEWKHPATR